MNLKIIMKKFIKKVIAIYKEAMTLYGNSLLMSYRN